MDHSKATTIFDILLFFACGIGISLCYIATLSSLVYFKSEFGPNSYVYLNFAVCLPLLPISFAQARWDQEYDKSLGSYQTFFFRGIFGFVVTIVVTALIPFTVNNHTHSFGLSSLIILTTLLGSAGAILHGTFNQLTSLVSSASDGGKLRVALASGAQASALIVLLVSTVTGFGSSESATGFQEFFCIIAGMEFILLLLFLVLMFRSHLITVSMQRRDLSFGGDTASIVESLLAEDYRDASHAQEIASTEERSSSRELASQLPPASKEAKNKDHLHVIDQSSSQLLSNENEENITQQSQQQLHQTGLDLSYQQLWEKTSLCCYTLILTQIATILMESWFTRVQSDFVALPQLLFYTRIFSDFFGRIAFIVVKKSISMKCLFVSSIMRFILIILFFVNASSKEEDHHTPSYFSIYSDKVSMILAIIISVSAGYQVIGCYQLAPEFLSMEQRDRNIAKQTSLLNVASSISAFSGICFSIILIIIGL